MNSIFDCKFKSLKDFMVPFPIFLQTVQYIEGCSFYDLDIITNSTDQNGTLLTKDDLYVIPYTYTEPCMPEYKEKACDINALSLEDYDRWKEAIDKRITSIVRHGITRRTIESIDDNPEIASIISLNSGHITSFSYTNARDIYIVDMHVNLKNTLQDLMKLRQVSPELMQSVEETHGVSRSDMVQNIMRNVINVDEYVRFIGMHDTFDNSDPYAMITANNDDLHDAYIAKVSAARILQLCNRHEKIILTV